MSDQPAPQIFRAGMELDEPVRFTPPEVRPGPQEWEKYRGPRFSRPVRIMITLGIWLIPGLLILQAVGVLMTGGDSGDGRARAAAFLFLFPLVPLAPLLIRAMRDLWGWE